MSYVLFQRYHVEVVRTTDILFLSTYCTQWRAVTPSYELIIISRKYENDMKHTKYKNDI